MNKSALKKFATEARKELLERVELQARKIGITAESIQKATLESSDSIFIEGKQLTDIERRQRNSLISRIREIGFNRVMEETAYTWFNRFIALRYMEVNDYLPIKGRILSSSKIDSLEPDMMKDALSLDLNLDKEYVYELKINNKTDQLFKYLIKMYCNDLNRYMPFMFETLEDYKEILFPDGLLGTDSFVRKMTSPDVIEECDWENVEIIGWLYQFYISEEKDEVFANLKKNIKVTKDNLPAATQLFTPNWIVRYMVENSLGRIWIENNSNSLLRAKLKYFLEEPNRAANNIEEIKKILLLTSNPEEITFLDPACGSGHILIYAFDIFYEMYLERGYMEIEIPHLILTKNLYGFDVDDRAVQIASFAVYMKAREKSRMIFNQGINLNVISIQDSSWLTDEMINMLSFDDESEVKEQLILLKSIFSQAKEYGSLIQTFGMEIKNIEEALLELEKRDTNLIEMIDMNIVLKKLPSLINQYKLLSLQYSIVCTNPPYMGGKSMNSKLSGYLKTNYPDTKLDLATAFIERCKAFTIQNGYFSLITPTAWMFITSYSQLRETLINNTTIINMLHLGRGVFGADFGTSAFVCKNDINTNYSSVFIKLFQRQGSIDSNKQKEIWFFEESNKYTIEQEKFKLIPSNPIAYWLTEDYFLIYSNTKLLSDVAELKQGIATADNDRFLRYWFEVNINNTTVKDINDNQVKINRKWFPYNKGGAFRKWYGNFDYVINWENDGEDLKEYKPSVIRNPNHQLKRSITWSLTNSAYFGARLRPAGSLFDTNGMSLFTTKKQENYILAFLCSIVSTELMQVSNPTLASQVGDVGRLPIRFSDLHDDEVQELVGKNLDIAIRDWDSNEISWDFKRHPLLTEGFKNVEDSLNCWLHSIENDIYNMKLNEERLNEIFIAIYGLEDSLSKTVEIGAITLNRLNKLEAINTFISYAVGCSFGRYSLDKNGLIYGGGEFNASCYKTFPADEDNILPVLSGTYFEDDIVTRFVDFVRLAFSEESLQENLDFISDAIGRKKNETAREALRRYFLNEFYRSHVQVYKKRPIYWLFTSGKEKAFNCLVYMHRYDKTTLSRIRTDYLHEVQIRMDAEKKDLLEIIEGDFTLREISNAKKELKSLNKKIDELKAYDELLHHMADMQIEIDLDDGVKHNYELFKGLVAKI